MSPHIAADLAMHAADQAYDAIIKTASLGSDMTERLEILLAAVAVMKAKFDVMPLPSEWKEMTESMYANTLAIYKEEATAHFTGVL